MTICSQIYSSLCACLLEMDINCLKVYFHVMLSFLQNHLRATLVCFFRYVVSEKSGPTTFGWQQKAFIFLLQRANRAPPIKPTRVVGLSL